MKISPKKDISEDVKELIRMQKEFPAASNCYNRKEKIEIIKITKEDKTDKKIEETRYIK